VIGQIGHLRESSELAVGALPQFYGHEQIGRQLVGGGVASVMETCAEASRLCDAGTTSSTLSVRKLPDWMFASAPLHLAIPGVHVRQQHRVGEQISPRRH